MWTDAGPGTRTLETPAPAVRGTPLPIDPHALLTLYTSGSSGTPKPVRKTLAQLDAEVHTLEAQWGALVGSATFFASVPHHHIYGLLFRVLWPLAAGRAFDRASLVEPQQLQQRIVHGGGAAVIVSTPSQLSRWPSCPGSPRLRRTCSFRQAVRWLPGWPANTPLSSARRRSKFMAARKRAALRGGGRDESDAWRPLAGVEVRRDGDADGALSVCSPHLGDTGWHRTDDAVVFDDDGRFRLQGRLDRVIKLDGKRVSLLALEARLESHPYVAQAAVAPLNGAASGPAPDAARPVRERAGAVVVLTQAGSAALHAQGRAQVARTLRRHLAAYFEVVVLPRHWRFRLSLPFDARGKLPAAAIAGAFAPRADGAELLSESRDWRCISLRVARTARTGSFRRSLSWLADLAWRRADRLGDTVCGRPTLTARVSWHRSTG